MLTDKYSASSSEGLSGALKDYDRAIIVGADKTTYGKGSMQETYSINPSMSVKVTISLFTSPKGGHKQFDGVTPDIVFETPKEKGFLYEKDLEGAINPKEDNNYLSTDISYMPNKEAINKQLKVSTYQKPTTQNTNDLTKEKTVELMTALIKLLKE